MLHRARSSSLDASPLRASWSSGVALQVIILRFRIRKQNSQFSFQGNVVHEYYPKPRFTCAQLLTKIYTYGLIGRSCSISHHGYPSPTIL